MRLHSIGAVFGALILTVLPTSGTAQLPATPMVPGEVLVKFRPGYEGAGTFIHLANRATVTMEISRIGVQLVKLAPGTTVQQGIQLYGSNPAVAYAEPNYIHSKRVIPNDPLYPQQYGATQMRLPEAWDITQGSSSVVIAVIDDGVDISHPDLAGNIVTGKDLVDGDNNPTPGPGSQHGTHVGGIAAAVTNNGVGVAGMGWGCKLMGIRFGFTLAQSAAGMIHAADNGAKVVNMSYGYYGPPTATESAAVDYAWMKGVLLVSAAGNINTNTLDSYPDGYLKVISVGSTDPNGLKSGFSDWGPRVDVAAPGSNIVSTIPGSGYANFTGTSMSSPGVCGVAGLLFAFGGAGVTNVEVRAALEDSAVNIGTWLQKGRVDAAAALGMIRPLISVDLNPTTVTTLEGVFVGGSVASISASDDAYYMINTLGLTRAGQTASAVVEFDIPFDPDLLRQSKLIVEAAGSILATNFLYLWDGTTWVSFRQFALRESDSTFSVDMGTTLRNWIIDGKVRMVTRANRAMRRGTAPFLYKIDRVRLETKVQS